MSITDRTSIARANYRDASQVIQFGLRSWGYAIADDQIPGVAFIEKFGRNPATSTGEVISDEGGTVTINTTASKVEIISSDADDDVGGTGAEAVLIGGVDINWNVVTETLVTNGLSAGTASVNDYLYVFRGKVVDSGAVRNAGNLTIRRESAGATEAVITAEYGQTQRAIFPVPAGCKLYINTFRMEGSKTGTLTGELGLLSYQLDEGIRVGHSIAFSSGIPQTIEWKDGLKVFDEKTLVWIEALDISAGAIITASFDGVVMRHTDSTV